MKREVTQSLWAAHRGVGVLLGALIFLLFVTGTLCTFRDEIRLWASPAVQAADRTPSQLASAPRVQRVLTTFAEHHPLETVPRFAVLLPLYTNGVYELLYQDPERRELVRAYVAGQELDYLGPSTSKPGEFLFSLHANLTVRGKVGRVMVGILGLACLFLVVTGVLIHRHKLRNAFSFRFGGSLRRTVGDAHRATGLWGVLFFAVIAFSGAALGLKSVLLTVPTVVEFKGDVAKARKALRPDRVSRSGQGASMQEPSALWQTSMQAVRDHGAESQFVPTILSGWAYGDANAHWVLSGSMRGALAPQNEALLVRLKATSGELIKVEQVHEQHWPQRIYSTMSPLHYGDFGGWPLKFLYAALGFAGILLVGSGLMIWLQRGTKTPDTQ